MMMLMISIVAVIIIVGFIVCRFLAPRVHQLWLCSSGGEEKIGFISNGYIVHSGSDILLGSTGSFKRFESVDRNVHEGEVNYGQSTLISTPWTTDKNPIPPQPLRLAPLPKSKNPLQSTSINKQASLEYKPISVPLKSVPRPIPRKQLSAPTSSSQKPLINPPQKIAKDVQATTNPFLSFASNNSSFFSTTVTSECKIENERATKSASVSRNPFINSCGDHDVFDFNPKTIKSIMEEAPADDGYLGDNDEQPDRIQLEALGRDRDRRKSSGSPKQFSPRKLPKSINSSNSESASHATEVNSNADEKFVDSPLNDESFAKAYRKHIRNRSFSENETSDSSVFTERGDPPMSSTNPFLNGKRLLKTPSETYLQTFSMLHANINPPTTHLDGLASQLSKPSSLNKVFQSSHPFEQTSIKRALSSDSISSDSSVIMSTLERKIPPTGNLCIALQYDKHTDGCKLLCKILEAKDLVIPINTDPDMIDTFVRVYLVPDESDAMQTKIFKNSRHPSYQEQFVFFITKHNVKRSLWFHLYNTNAQCTTLIGETEMKLTEIRKPLTTWLQLSDSRNGVNGDLMFSLSYLPTAERLTIVVVKARNLRKNENHNENENENVFVKVYLLKNNKKVSKKRTTAKRGEIENPVFNEALIFSVPPFFLNSIQVRLTVTKSSSPTNAARKSPIGHVIVGSGTDGKGLFHWHQMIASLRKPVAMFHPLRKST